MKKLLVVVDYQNDFVSGALGFPGAETLAPGIEAAVAAALAEGGYVLFTRDTHPAAYETTREGRFLPVPHCIEGTPGHQLYGGLHRYEEDPPPHVAIVDKPGFGSPTLAARAEALCGGAPDDIRLCGLVTDICVISNAILLHTAFQNAQVTVLEDLVGSGNAENGEAALKVLRGMGMA